MSAHTQLLGSKLMSATGEVSTDEALAGKKAIGLYFSAHWCPPCRGFTPVLAKAYTDHLKAKGMEIVFVSSDRSDADFQGYFGEQPWLALPYDARELKAKLSKKYKVSGIPSFVILDGETCETISTDGRSEVSQDPKGERFPWKPPTFWEALGTEFLSGTEGDTVDVEDIKGAGKYIGLYFSAHWCPPCKTFTPQLVASYKDHLKAKNLEIIFVSSDRDAASFMSYYNEMPWLAIPNGDARKNSLSKMFGVEGIPSFVIVDGETGRTITTKGRGAIGGDPTGVDFPYHPKPVCDLSHDDPDGINEELCVVAMLEGCDKAVVDAAVAAMTPIAAAAKAKGDSTMWFVASASEGPAPQIRKLTHLGEPTGKPQLLLLDIPDDGGFYVSEATEVTAESVAALLDGHKQGTLKRQQLG